MTRITKIGAAEQLSANSPRSQSDPFRFLLFRRPAMQSKQIASEELRQRGLTLRIWRPSFGSLGPPGFVSWRWFFWWLSDCIGLVAPHFFSPNILHVVMLYTEDGEQVFRAGVYPSRWKRPFMEADSIEIGSIGVPPKWCGQGIATLGVRAVLENTPPDIKNVYYICRPTNVPSIALAKTCGFEFFGHCYRKPRRGVFGRFWLSQAEGQY